MEYLQAVVDKFVFRVAPDCRYSDAGVWARRAGDSVRIGVTDFVQQRAGDVAFVNLRPVGTPLGADDEIAALETIKVDLILPAPLAGTVVAVNPALGEHPELINGDPYDEGWLVELEPARSEDFEALMDAATYLPRLQARAELEQAK